MALLLAEAIEEDGLTQAEFARRVGATPKHVNKVLTSQSSYASMETLDYWAFILGRHWTVELKKGR
jgi:transcriptional regulator with XRE-family HTH domain